MKRKIALLLATVTIILCFCTMPIFANQTGVAYCVMWSFGTPGEYYLSDRYYKVGEIPTVPDITPTKTDDERLFHFIGWDRDPEPIKQDTVYYAMYQVYEKKYAMNHDTQVTISDVTHLLSYLSDHNSVDILTDPDISGDGFAGIRDVTLLLNYLSEGTPSVVSGKTLLKEEKEKNN
ncbi:MAG: hypothetical protein IJZ37_07355 [Clostridia bacterium]|nr:hypothetical protein [Clostridia bacterium]MBQ8398399.1 hypothetical protein [Clostridia bacterium]